MAGNLGRSNCNLPPSDFGNAFADILQLNNRGQTGIPPVSPMCKNRRENSDESFLAKFMKMYSLISGMLHSHK